MSQPTPPPGGEYAPAAVAASNAEVMREHIVQFGMDEKTTDLVAEKSAAFIGWANRNEKNLRLLTIAAGVLSGGGVTIWSKGSRRRQPSQRSIAINSRLKWPIVGFVNIAILWAGFDTVREIFGV